MCAVSSEHLLRPRDAAAPAAAAVVEPSGAKEQFERLVQELRAQLLPTCNGDALCAEVASLQQALQEHCRSCYQCAARHAHRWLTAPSPHAEVSG